MSSTHIQISLSKHLQQTCQQGSISCNLPISAIATLGIPFNTARTKAFHLSFFFPNKLLFTVCIEPFVMTTLPISMYAALNFIFPFSFPERLPQIHRRGYCSRKLFKRLNLCVKLIIIIRGQLNLTTYKIR